MTISHPIQATFARLAARDQAHRDWLLTEIDPAPGWLWAAELADPASGCIPEILNRVGRRYSAGSARPLAALWFGHLVYPIAVVSAACLMMEQRLPNISLEEMWLRFDEYGEVAAIAWQDPAFAGLPGDPDCNHADFCCLPSRNDLRISLAQQLQTSLSAVVERVSACSSFGKPGLWALAADYMAYAFHAAGEALGDLAGAVEECRLFSAYPSRLSTRHGFLPVEATHSLGYLLNRTSCCHYYEVEGGMYCHSCPHRPLPERVQLMRQYLEAQQESTP